MKDFITAYEVVNEIRMTRSQYAGCFLIVEGEITDLRVYGRFIDPGSCQIIPAHGKENALRALEILENDDFNGVLTIVDADFWRLEGEEPTSPSLFITDAHDLEAMMLSSPALEKLLAEFSSTNKLDKFTQNRGSSVRQVLLDSGRPFGYLSWISDRQSLSLTFEDIAFSRFIDQASLAVDVVSMIRTVKNKSGRHDLAEEELKDAIDQVASATHDPWDICCGHDLVCILSLGLRRTLGSNQASEVKPELLEKFLRVAYEAVFFFRTELFQSLKAWEVANQPFRIFPPA